MSQKQESEQGQKETKTIGHEEDEDEIAIDSDDDDDAVAEEEQREERSTTKKSFPQSTNNNNTTTTNKKSTLQERLRKLKMKMNQSRKLNHKEVLDEGERLGSEEGRKRHVKTLTKNEKDRKDQEWRTIHSKALASSADVLDEKEEKFLVQPAMESQRQLHKKSNTVERNRYEVNDYYNPEGQFRNYERSIKSLRSLNNNSSTIVEEETTKEQPHQYYDTTQKSLKREREGAKRLADELKRRGDKTDKRKQKVMDFEASDVSYINDRNERFNRKINRNYDKHTVEIKQNLERGTAL